MENIDIFGKWETVYINGWPVEIKFISGFLNLRNRILLSFCSSDLVFPQ